jgi:hypothetical protein
MKEEGERYLRRNNRRVGENENPVERGEIFYFGGEEA